LAQVDTIARTRSILSLPLMAMRGFVCAVAMALGCQSAVVEELGLLQTRITPPALSACRLPAGATWAEVRLEGELSFYMAVYRGNDIVSNAISQDHHWEYMDPTKYGQPGHAYDIGGNIGSYSFALAKHGWNVTTFEPMTANVALFNASLCANPDLRNKIDLHQVGLSDAAAHCRLVSPVGNVGDGYAECGETSRMLPDTPEARGGYQVHEEFDVHVLDDQMPTSKFATQKIDFVKIDVEGFECHVFRGASKLLAQRPRIILTEVWGKAFGGLDGCTRSEYFKLFTDAQYKIYLDQDCSNEVAPESAAAQDHVSSYSSYFLCHQNV